MRRAVNLERLQREVAEEREGRRTTEDAHVRAYERHLLKSHGFQHYGHGWWRRGPAGPSMTDTEALSRIRAGQFDSEALK